MSGSSTGRSTATPSNGASPSPRPGSASDWILRLDADYMVEPALRDEIAALAPARRRRPTRSPSPIASTASRCAPRSIRRCRSCSAAAARRFVQDGHTEKLRIDGPVVPLSNRLLHDDRKSLERWLQSQSRYQAHEAEKLATRPWSELSWPDRLRCTRVLGPLAVAVALPVREGFDVRRHGRSPLYSAARDRRPDPLHASAAARSRRPDAAKASG